MVILRFQLEQTFSALDTIIVLCYNSDHIKGVDEEKDVADDGAA